MESYMLLPIAIFTIMMIVIVVSCILRDRRYNASDKKRKGEVVTPNGDANDTPQDI